MPEASRFGIFLGILPLILQQFPLTMLWQRFVVTLALVISLFCNVSLLQQNQFNFDLPTYLIWEGNTTLLAKADVISVLETIRDKFKHFRLSFDYMSDKVISRTTGEQDINDYIDRYESMYAPWITGFENIETLANSLKLKAIENF